MSKSNFNYGRALPTLKLRRKKVVKAPGSRQKPGFLPTPLEEVTDSNVTNEKISQFMVLCQTIINTLPCHENTKTDLIFKLNEYQYGFPEYCQCFFNETQNEDEPEDIWLSSLFNLVLTIRDQIESN